MITLRHLGIYNRHNRDYEIFERYGQDKYKDEMTREKWEEITALVEQIKLKNEAKLTQEEDDELIERIKREAEDEDVENTLYSIARNPIKPQKEKSWKSRILEAVLNNLSFPS